MHEVALSPEILERVARRRGRVHPFGAIEPRRTALLVVDMQNVFCTEGQVAHGAHARSLVPNINRLAGALRAAGGTVVWIDMAATPEAQAEWAIFFDHFCSPETRPQMIEGLTPGTFGHALAEGLDVRREDLRSRKTRFSAFIQGSSDLDAALKVRGIDAVIVTGVVTNVCCESTARDAMMLNYRTFFVTDGNAARSDAEHNATLNNLLNIFCEVRPTEEIVALIGAAGRAAA